MSGGIGSDTIFLKTGDGDNIVTDLKAVARSDDVIDLSGTTMGGLAAVLVVTSQNGADAVIQVTADDSITLIAIDMNTLHGVTSTLGRWEEPEAVVLEALDIVAARLSHIVALRGSCAPLYPDST